MTNRYRGSRRLSVTGAILALSLLTACSRGGGDAGASPTSTQSATATSESGVEDSPDTDSGTEGPAGDGASETAAPSATTDLDDVVEVGEQEVLDAVEWTEPVDITSGVTVTLEEVEEVDVEARVAGEIGGPAVAVTVTVDNDTTEELDPTLITVTASGADDTPLTSVFNEPADPFVEPVSVGSSDSAVYVFHLSEDAERPITITVNPAPSAPVAVFTGALS